MTSLTCANHAARAVTSAPGPAPAGGNRKCAFPSKRANFESSEEILSWTTWQHLVKHMFPFGRKRFLKETLFQCCYFICQNTIFRGTKNCKSPKQINIGKEQTRSPSCARMIYPAQDGGPLKDQKESRQPETQSEAHAFPSCRERNCYFRILIP